MATGHIGHVKHIDGTQTKVQTKDRRASAPLLLERATSTEMLVWRSINNHKHFQELKD